MEHLFINKKFSSTLFKPHGSMQKRRWRDYETEAVDDDSEETASYRPNRTGKPELTDIVISNKTCTDLILFLSVLHPKPSTS